MIDDSKDQRVHPLDEACNATLGPMAERISAIDTLRGIALGGVLLVNLVVGFRAPLSSHILGIDEPLGRFGALLLSLVAALVEFKAFTVFAFLFGVGVAIQAGQVEPKSAYFFMRRFGALLVVGLIHLLLVWNGDILTLYAVCGLLLIPLLRLPASALAVLGLLLVGASYVVALPVRFPDDHTLRELAAGAVQAYRSDRWQELSAFRWRETELLILPLLLLSFSRTMGLMVLGVAAWRRGLLRGNQRLWRWIMAVGATIGAAGVIAGNGQIVAIPFAFALSAAVLLLNPRASWIAAAGQMALTNYLFQSIIFGFIFYGYGMRYFGRCGVGVALAGGAILYCAQLAVSRWWLNRFYFGPFEWLWRSVSYLQWQPFMRLNARTVSRGFLFVLLPAFMLIPLIHPGGPCCRPGWDRIGACVTAIQGSSTWSERFRSSPASPCSA